MEHFLSTRFRLVFGKSAIRRVATSNQQEIDGRAYRTGYI